MAKLKVIGKPVLYIQQLVVGKYLLYSDTMDPKKATRWYVVLIGLDINVYPLTFDIRNDQSLSSLNDIINTTTASYRMLRSPKHHRCFDLYSFDMTPHTSDNVLTLSDYRTKGADDLVITL